jgi:hypothetical protein
MIHASFIKRSKPYWLYLILDTHWCDCNVNRRSKYEYPEIEISNYILKGRAIAQAVSRRLPTAAARVQTRVWSRGILWWTKVALEQVLSPRTSVSPVNLHSICFSTIIFTITRGWHNRPGVAAVLIASQTRINKKTIFWIYWFLTVFFAKYSMK